MPSSPGAAVIVMVLFQSVTGCAQFTTPSAYEDQRFLCDPNNFEFIQAVEDCRRVRTEQDCGGIWSLRGQLQGAPLTVSAKPTLVSFSIRRPETGPLLFSDFDATGESPYALVTLAAKAIGGNATDVPDTTRRTLNVVSDANARPDRFTDDLAGLSIRVSTRSESVDLVGLDDTGEVVLDLQSRQEVAGTFMGAFDDPDDFVEGCFHLFSTEVRISDLDP